MIERHEEIQIASVTITLDFWSLDILVRVAQEQCTTVEELVELFVADCALRESTIGEREARRLKFQP